MTWSRCTMLTHELKSCSATVGAYLFAAHCERLELIAQEGLVSDRAFSVETIGIEYRRVEAALIARLARPDLVQSDRAPQITMPSLEPTHSRRES